MAMAGKRLYISPVQLDTNGTWRVRLDIILPAV